MTARRSASRIRLAFAATLAPILLALPAEASEFVLVWDAPAACPSADLVRKQMLKRLGSQHPGLMLKAHATVTQEGKLFRVRLHTYSAGQRGLRTLEAKTCSELVDALAVIVAMAVDSEPGAGEPGPESAPADRAPRTKSPGPSATLAAAAASSDRSAPKAAASAAETMSRAGAAAAAAPEPPADAAPPADGAAPETQPAAPVASPAALDRVAEDDSDADAGGRAFRELGLQAVASLAGAVEAGILPGLGFGLTVRGGARLRRFRVEGALSRWFKREASSSQPGRGADVDGMAIAAWTCFRAVPAHTAPVPRLRSALPPDDSPAIEAGPCMGMELGQLQARSFGVSETGNGSGTYAAAGGGLRLGATASEWLSLDVRFEAFRVLHRPEFRVENLGTVHQPSAWSLRASLGAEAYFP